MEFKIIWKKIATRTRNIMKKLVLIGHDKLTVMFIPHSQRKIFNFQISNFTILFFTFLLSGIILVSVLAIKNYSSVREREEYLEQENVNIVTRLDQFKGKVLPLNVSTEQLKGEIAVLLNRIGALKGKVRADLPAGGVSIPIPDNVVNKNPGFSYDPLIKKLATITYVSAKLGEEIQKIRNHVKHFKKITANMPSVWPVFGGGFITSPYGPRVSPFTGAAEFHTGIDITGMPGTPIKAAADGTVIRSGFNGGYGIMVELKHNYGYSTVYAHCMRATVNPGEEVKKGQIIAYMGRTGAATGYHLHYEVKLGNNNVNPLPFMTFDQLF